jgi:ribonuclease H / adenosylcobalamin/alpha-ribazole phosphatase
MIKLLLRADGGSRGNPGHSACGFVVYNDNKIILDGAKYLGITTNNVAEWTGLIEGLKLIKTNFEQEILDNTLEIIVEMDSKLVIEQISGRWKVKDSKLKELFLEAKKELISIQNIIFNHIYREFNKDADRLVNERLDNLNY